MYVILRGQDIAFYDDDYNRLETTVRLTQPDLNKDDIFETNREIVQLHGKAVFRDEHEEEYQAQQELEQDKAALAAMQAQLAELKDEILSAQAAGDAEWEAEAKAAYQEILNA